MSYGLHDVTRLYRTVVINGYQQAISHGAFNNLNLNVPYDMQQQLKSSRPYYHIYRHKDKYDMESEQKTEARLMDKYEIPPLIKIDHVPIDLYDWYQEIGYDKKKKHFNGVTLKRHILNCIKEENTNGIL